MFEPFFIKALLAGMGIAALVGPVGCFVVWRRMAYFGDSLSHSALLGVALGILLGIGVNTGIVIVCILFSLLLIWMQRLKHLANDTLLGILAHAALSIGMVVLGVAGLRVNVHQYLFGDILAVTSQDIAIIYGGGTVLLGLLIWLWRPLLLATIHENLARSDGIRVEWINGALIGIMTCVVAMSVQLIGILLITSLLIIPAATARQVAKSPEQMAVMASVFGMVATVLGLLGSVWADTPSGPSIIVASVGIFALVVLGSLLMSLLRAHKSLVR
ncbi:MAG: metal ABC transporter permease [Alphaproteobacteria bacterium]|nr:metal ABC transporter permease [Alphaproteobacteria bacterium]